MTLEQYLKSENITAAAFGAKVGLSSASMSRICKGEQNLSRNLIRKIILASGGKVTADAMIFDERAA